MKPKIFITGAAGLVGQNLIARMPLADADIIAADKHPHNTSVLRNLHPDIEVIEADLAEAGAWEKRAQDVDVLIMLHAQIGGLDESEFDRNNIDATKRVLKAARDGRCSYIIHASSSVVNSKAVDFYTESKKAQETLIADSGIAHIILRPTLMFGWFDRKHLGWLKRFMERAPVFPIPGHGRYLRQPLYAGDFAAIIDSCIKSRKEGVFDISGQSQIDYIDLIRALRNAAKLKTPVLNIPYRLFWALLKTYALVDKNPPFTTHQLEALVTPDIFDVIDWPGIFNVPATPLDVALDQTFNDPRYAELTLEF